MYALILRSNCDLGGIKILTIAIQTTLRNERMTSDIFNWGSGDIIRKLI